MTTAPPDASSSSATIQCALFLSALSPDTYRHHSNGLLTHATDNLDAQIGEVLRAPRADLERLAEYALRNHLRVVAIRPDVGELRLEGTREDIERAFENLPVLLGTEGAPTAEGKFPVRLDGTVVGFFTSDETDTQRLSPDTAGFGRPKPSTPVFTARSLARHYSVPSQRSGAGVKVGIVLQGGGFTSAGLDTYFSSLGLRTPNIRVVEVGGAHNRPASFATMKMALEHLLGSLTEEAPAVISGPTWQMEAKDLRMLSGLAVSHAAMAPSDFEDAKWTIEGLMDLQVLAGVANGVSVTFYIAHNTTFGLYQAITQAADDDISVLSCSFSGLEDDTTARSRDLTDRALMYAVLQRMTVCFSSGNDGSGPAEATSPQVNYPSSSPWVLCCGGTQILPPLSPVSTEVVWNETGNHGEHKASGGGFSAVYPRPSWQVGLQEANTNRGLPDVASNAAHSSGVWLWIAKDDQPVGLNIVSTGTSAAAPLWAAVVAIMNESLGRRLGFLTPRLYEADVRSTMQPIQQGNNIVSGALTVYQAHPGWNACTGLGRPVCEALIAALGATRARSAQKRQPASSAG